jgi:putative membrane protein insertion efficiency factor
MKIFKFFVNLPKNFAVLLIKVYQTILSPDHSWLRHKYPYGFCSYYPSCSEYSKQVITDFGLFKGFLLSVVRIIKCNPLAQPSVDLVPKKIN